MPAKSWTSPAGTVRVTLPVWVMPATVTVYVVPSVPTGETMAELARAMPPIVTSPATKSPTASLNTTVKSIVAAFVGSAWVLAWLTVTVGWLML